MITCSSYRGQSYNPTSQFDCLADDIPYLPKNKEGIVIEDINFDYNISASDIKIKENTFLHKIKITNIKRNRDFIKPNFVQIKSLLIFGANRFGENKLSISPSVETAPPNAPFEHYGGLSPLKGKIALNKQGFLLADVDIGQMTKVDVKDMQQYDSSVVKISKIILDLYFYNNDIEVDKKRISLIITDKSIIEIQRQREIEQNKSIRTKTYSGLYITNGSVAFCMDTSEVYKFDEEYDRWLKL
ncbi:MAG: hypothetical protein ACLUCH_06125 [Lachnospirales bacterium]